jgi:hypothetical protein
MKKKILDRNTPLAWLFSAKETPPPSSKGF